MSSKEHRRTEMSEHLDLGSSQRVPLHHCSSAKPVCANHSSYTDIHAHLAGHGVYGDFRDDNGHD